MAKTATDGGGPRGSGWRIAGWGLAASLLLLPAVAMRFTEEVEWTASDFIFAAVVIGAVGLGLELAVRATRSWAYRAGAAAALAAAFVIAWATGAVGMIGSEDDPFNLLFGGVIALALAGALLARFRPAGMARAMLAAAAAQVCVALAGLATDPRGAAVSIALAALWLVSAAGFRGAARAGAPTAGQG